MDRPSTGIIPALQHQMAIHAPFVHRKGGFEQLSGRIKDALADIPNALKVEGADYPILRIFASWRGDAKLERTLDPRDKDVGYPDQHPLATLHLENFNEFAEKLAREYFRGSK
jgi:hypothetical protein